jgi:hypothetical protein
MYLSTLTDSLFERLDLDAITAKLGSVTFHPIYICHDCHGLRFNNVKASGGSGFAVQLWRDAGGDSDDIVFDGLEVNHAYPIVIGDGFSKVQITNLTIDCSGSAVPCVMLSSPTDVIIDGFACSGGLSLVGCYGGAAPQGVIFRNGTYHGPKLGSVPGVTIESSVRMI